MTGEYNIATLPRTAKAAQRVTKALQNDFGGTWRKALDNRAWSSTKGDRHERQPSEARPGPWAPRDDEDDNEKVNWAWQKQDQKAVDSWDWQAPKWGTSGPSSSSTTRPAPYASWNSWEKR